MQPRIFLSALAAMALFAGAAAAETAPTPPEPPKPARPMMRMMHMDQTEMAQHMARLCADRYAQAVGKLAYLETKLALTPKQKPLFDRWKDSLLTSIKAHTDACAALKIPAETPSLVERLKLHQKMMEAALQTIKAQMPALEALNASLTEEQQKVLDQTARGLMQNGFMRHMGQMGQMNGMQIRRRIMLRNLDGEVPPPAPAAAPAQ